MKSFLVVDQKLNVREKIVDLNEIDIRVYFWEYTVDFPEEKIRDLPEGVETVICHRTNRCLPYDFIKNHIDELRQVIWVSGAGIGEHEKSPIKGDKYVSYPDAVSEESGFIKLIRTIASTGKFDLKKYRSRNRIGSDAIFTLDMLCQGYLIAHAFLYPGDADTGAFLKENRWQEIVGQSNPGLTKPNGLKEKNLQDWWAPLTKRITKPALCEALAQLADGPFSGVIRLIDDLYSVSSISTKRVADAYHELLPFLHD